MMSVLFPLGAFGVLGLLIACPIGYRGCGRHVSRGLARVTRLDSFGVMTIQTAWILAECGSAVFSGRSVAVVVMMAVSAVWLSDDLLTGGPDNRRKRKHKWARVKLRMPKPVKLRPAERTPAPVPA